MAERGSRLAGGRLLFWGGVAALLLAVALLGPELTPHDPLQVDLTSVNHAPDKAHLMGTDYIGRCIACRLVHGAARSICSAVLVVAVTFAVGTAVGNVCGYVGGVADGIIMRIVDSIQAFPGLVFTVAVAGMLGQGTLGCMIAMTATGWAGYARLARSQALSLKERPFVEAARLSGLSSPQILLRTVLPNSLRPLVVAASMHVGNAILGLAGLSYLGLGTAPPYPEWGAMLSDGRERLQTAPWAVIFPGLAILLVVMVMGMLGDSVNEALNPKARGEKRR